MSLLGIGLSMQYAGKRRRDWSPIFLAFAVGLLFGILIEAVVKG